MMKGIAGKREHKKMGSRRGEGGEDQRKKLGQAPRGKRDRNGEAVTFGDQQAVNGAGEWLNKAVTSDDVREAFFPTLAKGAAMHVRKRVAETSASRPGKVQGSNAKS